MGYYTIRLDTEVSKICTIILPWGQYTPQELMLEMAGSSDKQIVRGNGIPRNVWDPCKS
jgi:hypothetical protein